MNLKISRTKRSSDFNMKSSHYHDFYELYYLLSGHCRIFINHTLYYVEPGDMILLEPGKIHRTTYHSSTASDRIAIYFGQEYMEEISRMCGGEAAGRLFKCPKTRVSGSRKVYVESLLERLEQEAAGQDEYSPMLAKGYLYELLIGLTRIQDSGADQDKLEVGETSVEEAAQYIYEHFREPVSLSEVADRVHMSPTYFSRKFKAVTGFGYKEYLTNIRIREAAGLLLTTTQSITDIAMECGFGDSNYFGDAFKKSKGMSPREYRKSHAMEITR